MEEKLKNALLKDLGHAPDPDTVSSRSLAFIGDAVYELKIRDRALKAFNGQVKDLNAITKELSAAKAQSKIAEGLSDFLTEEEIKIYKRGRNVKSIPAPHSCSIGEYRKATGLEALLGYLYIEGNEERIDEIINEALRSYFKESSRRYKQI